MDASSLEDSRKSLTHCEQIWILESFASNPHLKASSEFSANRRW
jgi:hypothetical protein